MRISVGMVGQGGQVSFGHLFHLAGIDFLLRTNIFRRRVPLLKASRSRMPLVNRNKNVIAFASGYPTDTESNVAEVCVREK
jgi:hypothetical protein